MTAHDPRDSYEEWDAAYVLGALSSAERHEFEEHLSGCSRCSGAVAELAGMPGLLGALPANDAFAMLEADAARGTELAAGLAPRLGSALEPAPPSILTGLTARVRRRRRARAWGLGLVGVAAAAAIAAAIVLPMTADLPATPTVSASLTQVVHSPLSASIQLTNAAWGTRIAMSCTYSADATATPGLTGTAPGYSAAVRYGLYVTDRHGTTTRVSSWSAGPGSTVHTDGSIDTAVADIARVEVRSLDAGTVLLSRTLS
ncbi:MAG: zf-HC2 domain-containing protein [Microbacteriaceae bacterium]